MSKFLVKIGVLIFGLVFIYHYANAQHPSHAQFHEDFYKDLKRRDGVSSCCSNKDCRRLDDWRMTPSGKYHVKVDGEWIMPPQWVVQHKQTPDGEAHGCYTDGRAPIEGSKVPMTDPSDWTWFCLIIPITSI